MPPQDNQLQQTQQILAVLSSVSPGLIRVRTAEDRQVSLREYLVGVLAGVESPPLAVQIAEPWDYAEEPWQELVEDAAYLGWLKPNVELYEVQRDDRLADTLNRIPTQEEFKALFNRHSDIEPYYLDEYGDETEEEKPCWQFLLAVAPTFQTWGDIEDFFEDPQNESLFRHVYLGD